MRKMDLKKGLDKKAPKTINFDVVVLLELERCCEAIGIPVSEFVNLKISDVVMDRTSFHDALGKYYYDKYLDHKKLRGSI